MWGESLWGLLLRCFVFCCSEADSNLCRSYIPLKTLGVCNSWPCPAEPGCPRHGHHDRSPFWYRLPNIAGHRISVNFFSRRRKIPTHQPTRIPIAISTQHARNPAATKLFAEKGGRYFAGYP